MPDDRNSAQKMPASSGASGVAGPSSNLRQRPLGRASTLADISNLPTRRRSSVFSDSSVRSAADDILVPKVHAEGFESHEEEPSHWHSLPLLLALLPAVGGLLFEGGGVLLTDVTLLALAAVFLNWSVRVPWYEPPLKSGACSEQIDNFG